MKRSVSKCICRVISVAFVLALAFNGAAFSGEQDAKVKLDINQATVKELSNLPGIGKKRAEAIVAHRNEKGKFSSVDDLNKVEGIGKKTLEKIRDSLIVSGG